LFLRQDPTNKKILGNIFDSYAAWVSEPLPPSDSEEVALPGDYNISNGDGTVCGSLSILQDEDDWLL
jgi:hypothetical protein